MATVTPPWAYTLRLPHDLRAPGIARTTLRAVLASHDMAELIGTAELLASELVTNAHRHTQGPYTLDLRPTAEDRVRLAVWDTSTHIPPGFAGSLGGPPPPGTEHGRGLHLVQAYADAWGAHLLGDAPTEARGKLLWAECTRHPGSAG